MLLVATLLARCCSAGHSRLLYMVSPGSSELGTFLSGLAHIVYFAEYFVTGYWRMIVVVLICELDITKEDYCVEQKIL